MYLQFIEGDRFVFRFCVPMPYLQLEEGMNEGIIESNRRIRGKIREVHRPRAQNQIRRLYDDERRGGGGGARAATCVCVGWSPS